MADSRSVDRLPAGPIVDDKGMPTPEFSRWLDALVFGGGRNTIGKQVSGIAEANQSISSLQGQVTAANTNVNSVAESAAGSGNLTVSGSSAYAFAFSASPPTATTSSVTVTPSGGVSPYTYSWTYVSGDTFTADSSTSATSTFSISIGSEETKTGYMKCTVTDSTSGTPLTASFTVYCEASSGGI